MSRLGLVRGLFERREPLARRHRSARDRRHISRAAPPDHRPATLYLRAGRAQREQPLLDPLQLARIVVRRRAARLQDARALRRARSSAADRAPSPPARPDPAPARARRSSRRIAAESAGTGDVVAGHRVMASRRSLGDLLRLHHARRACRRARSPRPAAARACSIPRPHGADNPLRAARARPRSRCAVHALARLAALVPKPFDLARPASSSPPNASSSRRWVAVSTSARSSCWPWISTSTAPRLLSACTLTGWSLTKARVLPSANCTRRRISASSAVDPVVLHAARAPDACGGSSNIAVTWPCSAPWRTSAASPRAPSARRRHRADRLAGAGLAGKHGKPSAKSRSSRSIRTISRIESRASMVWLPRSLLPVPWAKSGSPYQNKTETKSGKPENVVKRR